MRTQAAAQEIGARVDSLMPMPIGSVITYYSSVKVVGVAFTPGCRQVVRVGDQLQFGPHPKSAHGRAKRLTVSSMERWHESIEEASGPEAVAIFTGFHVRRGTPVFLLVKPV